MTDQSRRPTDKQIMTRALEILHSGVLAGDLPSRLIDEFGLTPERAADLTRQALRRRGRGRLATKPLKPEE